jgi:hypothetical protein
MRALCGAIITAGALIGLGLAALGAGQRYSGVVLQRDEAGNVIPLHLHQFDRPLVFSIVFLTCVALVGLGIALLGLAYHHHRRHHEHLREQERLAGQQRTTV